MKEGKSTATGEKKAQLSVQSVGDAYLPYLLHGGILGRIGAVHNHSNDPAHKAMTQTKHICAPRQTMN